MEDITTFTTRNTPLTAAGRIVDAVVKLYVPDHTYKYLDMSPVSSEGVGVWGGGGGCESGWVVQVYMHINWRRLFLACFFLPSHLSLKHVMRDEGGRKKEASTCT